MKLYITRIDRLANRAEDGRAVWRFTMDYDYSGLVTHGGLDWIWLARFGFSEGLLSMAIGEVYVFPGEGLPVWLAGSYTITGLLPVWEVPGALSDEDAALLDELEDRVVQLAIDAERMFEEGKHIPCADHYQNPDYCECMKEAKDILNVMNRIDETQMEIAAIRARADWRCPHQAVAAAGGGS